MQTNMSKTCSTTSFISLQATSRIYLSPVKKFTKRMEEILMEDNCGGYLSLESRFILRKARIRSAWANSLSETFSCADSLREKNSEKLPVGARGSECSPPSHLVCALYTASSKTQSIHQAQRCHECWLYLEQRQAAHAKPLLLLLPLSCSCHPTRSEPPLGILC